MLTGSEVRLLQKAMESAGEAILEIYHNLSGFGTSYKADSTPVTDADLASNRILTEFLQDTFAGLPVISEESDPLPWSVRKNTSKVWLVDPMDGTREFLNRTGEFTINIGLVENGKAVGGFVYVPVTGRFYYGLTGEGSFEVTSEGRRKLMVSRYSMQSEGIRVVMSRTHTEPATMEYLARLRRPKTIYLGSALKFIALAEGQADYYPRMLSIMEWDTAAGQVLIEEAGGSLVDAATGSPLVYNKKSFHNPYFIASGLVVDDSQT